MAHHQPHAVGKQYFHYASYYDGNKTYAVEWHKKL